MRKRPISVDEVIFDGCDLEFAGAIERFIRELNASPSYSLLSKRYSVFSVMKKHLDASFADLESRYDFNMFRGVIVPSAFKSTKRLGRNQSLNDAELTAYRKVCVSLESWALFIGELIKGDLDQRKPFIAALDSLKMIAQLLAMWCGEARESISRDKLPGDKARTKKHIQPKLGHCLLCWQPLNHTSGGVSEQTYGSINQTQTKYCFSHDRTRNTEDGWRNYVRDRRYDAAFKRELASLTKREASNYHPNANWYIGQARERGVDVGVTEIRKIIYFLIRSGLDTPRRKEIYALNEKGYSIVDISRQLGITRQAVHKTIKQIDLRMSKIINCLSE